MGETPLTRELGGTEINRQDSDSMGYSECLEYLGSWAAGLIGSWSPCHPLH